MLVVYLGSATLVAACMTTHAYVSERALDSALLIHDSNILPKISLPSLHAGSFFPDWGYACANQGNAAEEAHWPKFWTAAFKHLHQKYPPLSNHSASLIWTDEAIPLISFYLGIISHSVADYTWHSLDKEGWGFVEALGYTVFGGSYSKAHSMADFGGEFALAHSMDLNSIIQLEWRVPTGDLVEIYKDLGFDVTVLELNTCMSQGYLASQGIRVAGRYLYPRWAQEDLRDLPTHCSGGIRGDGALSDKKLLRLQQDSKRDRGRVFTLMNGAQARLTHGKNDALVIGLKDHLWLPQFLKQVLRIPLGKTQTTESTIPEIQEPTKLKRLLSTISEGTSEMLSIVSSWVFGPRCHSIAHIQSVSKMNTFYSKKDPHGNLGDSITSGDFTKSGFPDLVLAAPGYSDLGTSQIGCVFVLSNMSHEYLMTSVSHPVETVAAVKIYGPLSSNQMGGRFGSSLAVLDFNLDGIDDLVVSAPWSYHDTGAVFVFYGSSEGGLSKNCKQKKALQGDQCVLNAEVDADVVILATTSRTANEKARGFGTTMSVGDLTLDAAGGERKSLLIGSPYFGTAQSPNRGIVHMFESKPNQIHSMTLDNALWSLSAPLGGGIAFEGFGTSVAVVDGIVFVGAPGWRLAYFQQAFGRVYAFKIVSGLAAPVLVGSVAHSAALSGFGSQMIVGSLDNSGKQYVFISSPTETSREAQPKFMDLPGILTPISSRGYAAGTVRVIDPESLLGTGRSLDSITLTRIEGSRSNARLGASGWFIENGEMWVAESTAEGESGKIHRIESSTIFSSQIFSTSTNNRRPPHGGGHRHDPQFLADLFPQLKCIYGAASGDRFGVSIHRMDFDDDGGSDLLVATGTGFVHMFW
ncbi:hypothetical protein BDR26DRAFT_932355 [Obelidium mucronatum]|nr:hypothetical protein BDR26DRAFT_932355 [Obelidium mucronatum]